jgi:hypothetical protein
MIGSARRNSCELAGTHHREPGHPCGQARHEDIQACLSYASAILKREVLMVWAEIRKAYPDQWLIIEAIEAHTADDRRLLDRVAVVETCSDGTAAMQAYERLHHEYPAREFYFVHTDREELDIRERRWIGIRRNDAAYAQR